MTSKEEFLANCDYQMKKIELAKEAVFFQTYSKGYEVAEKQPENLSLEEEKEKERE